MCRTTRRWTSRPRSRPLPPKARNRPKRSTPSLVHGRFPGGRGIRKRPYTLDYLQGVFTHVEELHGDRSFSDDPAIVGALARLNGEPVMVIGQQKGRDTKEKIYRNFGMPRPEGYRKALRLYRLAEKFGLAHHYPDRHPRRLPRHRRGRTRPIEAIARNLYVMAELRTPSLPLSSAKAGSGGALALAWPTRC